MSNFIKGLIFGLVLGFIVTTARAADDALFTKLSPSVVKLTGPSGSGGTGFLITAKSGGSFLITNAHVCAIGSQGLMLAEKDNEFQDVFVKILETDDVNDLCILSSVPGPALKTGKAPTKFQPLYVVGHPLLHPQTPAEGYYVDEQIDKVAIPTSLPKCPKGFIAAPATAGLMCFKESAYGDTTIPIFPGNSGSPAVDANGDVVGVMVAVDRRTGFGSMVPLRFLLKLLGKH